MREARHGPFLALAIMKTTESGRLKARSSPHPGADPLELCSQVSPESAANPLVQLPQDVSGVRQGEIPFP